MLTAAHCFHDENVLRKVVNINVVVNLTDVNDLAYIYFATATVGLIHVHPAYEETTTLKNDIALLQLDRPIFDVAPVDFNDDPMKPADGELLEVFGFGLLEEFVEASGVAPKFPDKLQVVTVEVVSNDGCISQLGLTVEPALQICAALPGKVRE